MSIIECIKRKANGFEISTKITFVYATCFAILMIVINFAMWVGVMTALYNPAENTIIYSMEQVKKIFKLILFKV